MSGSGALNNEEAKIFSQDDKQAEELEKYRKAALAKEQYLRRRQKKDIFERCRRIAVVGARPLDPTSASYVQTQKLLGLGVEIVPVMANCPNYLGVRCYPRLSDVPGAIDVVQVYPTEAMDLLAIAREAAHKKAAVFWVEGEASAEVREVLAGANMYVVEHENLAREYIRHHTGPQLESRKPQQSAGGGRVANRMTLAPVTVHPSDGIKDALAKMKKGGFRHLPVVDAEGKLIGMLSDRDIRLVRPSLAFVKDEEAALQIWSTSVRQAMVFNPVSIEPEASIEAAAQLMLHWGVGALPVVKDRDVLVGIITYTDLLRELIARAK
jgi:CBS domain-containing protein/predicted CoA-binding protein